MPLQARRYGTSRWAERSTPRRWPLPWRGKNMLRLPRAAQSTRSDCHEICRSLPHPVISRAATIAIPPLEPHYHSGGNSQIVFVSREALEQGGIEGVVVKLI